MVTRDASPEISQRNRNGNDKWRRGRVDEMDKDEVMTMVGWRLDWSVSSLTPLIFPLSTHTHTHQRTPSFLLLPLILVSFLRSEVAYPSLHAHTPDYLTHSPVLLLPSKSSMFISWRGCSQSKWKDERGRWLAYPDQPPKQPHPHKHTLKYGIRSPKLMFVVYMSITSKKNHSTNYQNEKPSLMYSQQKLSTTIMIKFSQSDANNSHT